MYDLLGPELRQHVTDFKRLLWDSPPLADQKEVAKSIIVNLKQKINRA